MKRLIAIAVLILLVLPRLQAQEQDSKIEFETTHTYIFDANSEPLFRGGSDSLEWELNFNSAKLITRDDDGEHPLYLEDFKMIENDVKKMVLNLIPTPGENDMKITFTVYHSSPVDDIKVAIYRNKNETGSYATTTFFTTYEVDDWTQLID